MVEQDRTPENRQGCSVTEYNSPSFLGFYRQLSHSKNPSLSCLLNSWIFSVAGALLSIPFGIKRKSFAPLVFFGSTGAMLDIWMGVSNCEREFQERQQRLLLEREAAALAEKEVAEDKLPQE